MNTDAVSWREVDGEVIALRHASSEYMTTNGSGAVVWNALLTGATRTELVDLLVTKFAVDAPRAAADVDAFVAALATHGLLAA